MATSLSGGQIWLRFLGRWLKGRWFNGQWFNGQWFNGPVAALVVGLVAVAQVQAQESKSDTEELLGGLLELVERPDQSSSPKPADKSPSLRPEDIGMSQAELEAANQNPLVAVQQSMAIAAGFLERGSTGDETQQLQKDILNRLSELLDVLNQPKSRSKQDDQTGEDKPSQGSTSQTESESTPADNAAQQQQQQASDQDDDLSSEQAQQQRSDSPAMTGPAASGKVRLADPKALQQGVWGNLPPKVREQMQARMVEQFLPSYRKEIENYYRLLLQQYPVRQ